VSDDQALHNGSGGYGPLTHIIPSPAIATRTTVASYPPGGVLVALVIVDTTPIGLRHVVGGGMGGGPLPPTYNALNLQRGHNCLYLSHDGPDEATGWAAYVTPTLNSSNPCPDSHGTATALTVEAIQHPLFTLPEDYPPVARFHEGTRGLQRFVPQMGVKCANRWCIVTAGSIVLPQPQTDIVPGGLTSVTARPWRNVLIRGWNDVQHLGEAAITAGGAALPKFGVVGFHAAFVADTGLGNYDTAKFSSGPWIHVGQIWMPSAPLPVSKYHTKWKLKQGPNELYLKANSTGSSWTGILVAGPDTVKMTVTRDPHLNFVIPGVVRFRWDFTDEQGWVRCDVGCCKVAPT
jgi:hypothetical protein